MRNHQTPEIREITARAERFTPLGVPPCLGFAFASSFRAKILQFGSRISCGFLLSVLTLSAVAAPAPADFPSFTVPGHEKEMSSLRDLFWLHYPAAGPKATLWDEWLPDGSLWPAVTTGNQCDSMRHQWRDVLSARILDPEGYVATHQHASIAHQLGWPFPFWNQGRRGCGWHFSFKDTIGIPRIRLERQGSSSD